jgi:uncharacterized protein involved in exopolysaccharide biosynthesis
MQSIDFRYLVGAARRRLNLVLLLSLAGFLATLIVVKSLAPLYKSEGRLQIQSSPIAERFSQSLSGDPGSRGLLNLKTTLFSRQTLLDAAAEFQVFSDQPSLSPDNVFREMKRRVTFEIVSGVTAGPAVEEGPGSFELKIGFHSSDRNTAQKIASRLIDTGLAADLSNQTAEAEEAVAFLRGQVGIQERELAERHQAVMEFISENMGSLPANLPSLGSEINQIEHELADFQQGKLAALQSATLTQLREELNAAKSELAVKGQTYAPNHPDMRILRLKVLALERKVRDEELRLSDEQPARLWWMQEQPLRERLARAKNLVAKAPETELVMQQLGQEKNSVEKHLDLLRDKLGDAERNLAMVRLQYGDRLRVIERPSIAGQPFWPNYWAICGIGFGLSLFVAGAIAAALEVLPARVRCDADLIKVLNRNAIIVVPFIATKRDEKRRLSRWLFAGGLGALCAATLLAAIGLSVHRGQKSEFWLVRLPYSMAGELGKP